MIILNNFLKVDMTKEEIQKDLVEIIEEILGESKPESNENTLLIEELGFDSLDLLDMTFHIEEKFGVKIGSNELSGRAKGKYKQSELVDEKGFLTELSLTELKNSIPEIPSEKLVHGLRENDIPKLLTIGVFVRLIEEKLA